MRCGIIKRFLACFVEPRDKKDKLIKPFPIVIVEFPKQYQESLATLLFGIKNNPPKASREYLALSEEI